jgi:hypothetical protein
MAVAMPQRQIRVASGLDTLAGIWLFISALIFSYNAALAWDLAIVGIVVAVLAASRAFGNYRPSWPSWVNAVLGVWTIISPWVFVRTASAAMVWDAVITGIAIIVLAVWSALATDSTTAPPPGGPVV